MPDRTLGKIMTATDSADVAQLAMIEAMRQIADTGKNTNRILEAVQAEVKDVRERVIRIEATEFKALVAEVKMEVADNRKRIDRLEAHEDRRVGAVGFLDAMLKYGPFVIALVTALFVLLVATKRIVL